MINTFLSVFSRVMARICMQRGLSWRKARAKRLQTLALVLLADADDADEEMFAILVAHMAQKAKKEAQSLKYGIRGPYDEAKVCKFFNNLVFEASERSFKAWFR
jgi:hypothetical protein